MKMTFNEGIIKITPEILDELKNKENFKFCRQHLYKHFNITQHTLEKVLNYHNYEIPRLTKNKLLTTDEWIKKAIDKRGDRYDYSKVNYIDSYTHVEIGCKEHGFFPQNPSSHLNRGDNCPKCGLEERASKNRTSFEEWLSASEKIHNYKFDYSLAKPFKQLKDEQIIICPIHGEFKQNGGSHMTGSDCEKCSYEKRGVDYSISKEEMLNRFKDFNNNLIYDMSGYKNTNSIIHYECSIHGRQKQTAAKHLKSKNCWKCNKSTAWNTSNTEDFIEKALIIHNNYYSYSKSVYVKNSSKVIITCPHHGDFKQRPNNHLLGAGCDVCANITSNFKDASVDKIEQSKTIPCFLYIMYFPREDFYKIGLSRNIENRKKGIKYDSNLYYRPEIIFYIETTLFLAAGFESDLHKKYKSYRHKPKTLFKGSTECFTSDLPIEEIKEYLLNKS